MEEVISKDAGWLQKAREREKLFKNFYEYVRKRFFALEKHFHQGEALKQKYLEFIKKYKQIQHMELNKGGSEHTKFKCCCILSTASCSVYPMKSYKLRVVFNASAKTSNGFSLNDIL